MISELNELLHNLGRLINDFGPYVFGLVALLVIVILLFVVLLYLVKYITKGGNNKELTDQIALLQSQLNNLQCNNQNGVNPNAIKFTPERQENLMNVFLRINNSLKHTCRELLNEIDSDRVAFYLFHNGTHSTRGVPFLKTSCICEFSKSGYNAYHLIQEHKDLPISFLGSLVSDLVEKREFVIYKNDTIMDAFISRIILNEEDKTCLFCGIFDPDSGEVLGFITAEFNNVTKFDPDDLREKQEELREISKRTISAMQVISALK